MVLSGCANIIPPGGGPRDSLPPRLVKVTPPDSSTGFGAKTITFTFDEFIEDIMLQNPIQNMVISPNYKVFPKLESKLRTLTLKINDTLEPNTTYKIDFGDVIKDVNEKNVLRNFAYIFSTGAVIDSLNLSGNIILAETGGIDTTLIVMLHRNGDDSAVVKESPRYISKLDGKGNFHFSYLPSGTFYLYALKDEGGRRSYTDTTQLFAFADSAIEIKPGATPVTLYAYAAKKEQQTPNVSVANISRGAGARTDDRRLKLFTNLSAGTQDLLTDFIITFEKPLRNIDTTRMQLSTDSSFTPAVASWQLDSLKKKLTLNTTWKENTRYNLIVDRDFAEDSAGRKLLKTDTLNFTTKKQSDYGAMKLSFINLDLSPNPVLLLSQNNQVMKSFPLTSTEFYQPTLLPGEYELSVLFDKNKNGHWDPGQFFGTKKQPELVKPLNKKITIRPGFENEFEIRL